MMKRQATGMPVSIWYFDNTKVTVAKDRLQILN